MNSDEWYHEPVVQPLYHTGCYLAVDLTVNQGQGGDAQVPVIVRFGNRDAGTMNIELHTLLGCPRGLRPGSYKLLVDIGAYLPQMEDGTNYFGTIIERRGLYGGNITVRQFALVTAQRVEKPDAGQLYTGLDGVPYLVHEQVGRAALNIPAGPLNQNDAPMGRPTVSPAGRRLIWPMISPSMSVRCISTSGLTATVRQATSISTACCAEAAGFRRDTTAASSLWRVRCITMHSGEIEGAVSGQSGGRLYHG